jgi:integrase
MKVLEEHLRSFVGPEVDAPLFLGRTGLALRPQGLEEAWRSARKEVGLPALRFHDLRHFAGTMAAAAGASTNEVMARAGGPRHRWHFATSTPRRSVTVSLLMPSRR